MNARLALVCPLLLVTQALVADDVEPLRAPARAVDVFGDAHVTLLPPAFDSVPEPRVVLEESFELEAGAAPEGWTVLGVPTESPSGLPPRGTPIRPADGASAPSSPPAAAIPKPLFEVTTRYAQDGRSSVTLGLAAGAPTGLPQLSRLVEVKPSTSYQLEVYVRTEDLEPDGSSGFGASVEIVELGKAEATSPPLVQHQHLPRERGTSTHWKLIRYSLRTSEVTRALRLRLIAALGKATGRAYFDSLRLVEVPALVSFLESSPLRTANRTAPPHPLVKRLAPDTFDHRPAILSPVPTRWRLPVEAAEDTLLRLSLGILPDAASDARVCFRVCWHEAGAVDSEQAAGAVSVCPPPPPPPPQPPRVLEAPLASSIHAETFVRDSHNEIIRDSHNEKGRDQDRRDQDRRDQDRRDQDRRDENGGDQEAEGILAEEVQETVEDHGRLLERCMTRGQRPRGWRNEALDLKPFAGRSGELWLETSGTDGAPAVWGNPRLSARRRAPGDTRPNVVVLVVDTLRADHLGIEGYPKPTSPRLDTLARASVRFNRAYSTSSWTAPSLSSLFTGRYPSQHHGGVRVDRERGNHNPKKVRGGADGAVGWENRLLGKLFQRATALSYHPIGDDERTLAERLRAAGYATAGWHSNYNSSGVLGLSRGFDSYRMFSGVSRRGAISGAQMVRAWLAERRRSGEEGPYFVLFHTQDPHLPYRLRREHLETFGPVDLDWELPDEPTDLFREVQFGGPWALELWSSARFRAGHAAPRLEWAKAFYDSEIAQADAGLGQLLDALDERTLIVFTADHGEEFGEHGEYEHGHSLYDEVVRVPLWIRLPGNRHGGTEVDEPVSLVDIAPTLLRLVGAEPLPNPEGRPLIPLAGGARPRSGVFLEAMLRGPDRTALVEGRYKYILRHPEDDFDTFPPEPDPDLAPDWYTAAEELYDLENDPGERHDLLTDQPVVAARLRRQVHAFLAETSHGVHLRCGGLAKGNSLVLEVASTETIGLVKPMTLDREDRVTIAPTRRSFELRLAPDGMGEAPDSDWTILRLLRLDAELSLRASASSGRVAFFLGNHTKAAGKRGLRLKLGDPAAAAPPQQMPRSKGPWCQVWEVAGAAGASGDALDSAIADELRALGYL